MRLYFVGIERRQQQTNIGNRIWRPKDIIKNVNHHFRRFHILYMFFFTRLLTIVFMKLLQRALEIDTTWSGSMSFALESDWAYCQVLWEGTVRRNHRVSIHLLPYRLIRFHLDNLMLPLIHSPLCGTFPASYFWFHFVIINFLRCTISIGTRMSRYRV